MLKYSKDRFSCTLAQSLPSRKTNLKPIAATKTTKITGSSSRNTIINATIVPAIVSEIAAILTLLLDCSPLVFLPEERVLHTEDLKDAEPGLGHGLVEEGVEDRKSVA